MLFAVLLASLILNGMLYQRAHEYYARSLAGQLDPLGLGYHPQKGPVGHAEKGALVMMFYGDSRAAEWPAVEGKRVHVINRGIHGQTTRQILDRYPFDVKPFTPDLLLIQAGVNDLKAIPLLPDQRVEIVAQCKSNLTSLVQAGLDDGAQVILTTIFPVGPPALRYRPVWSGDVAKAVAEVNTYLMKLADDPRVHVLDAVASLANDEGGLADEFRIDHLHLNALGYERLNLKLAPLLPAHGFFFYPPFTACFE